MTEANTPAVYAGVLGVTDDLRKEGIGKRNSNGLRFSYRSIEDVYSAVAPLLVKHKIVIVPEEIVSLPEMTVPTKSGSQRLTRIGVAYRVSSSVDGSSFICHSIGEGMDSSDKCAGKAMSYAYKNLIFQLFSVPVEGQPDPDATQDQHMTAEPAPALTDDLAKRATEAAQDGMDAYKAFFAALTKDERKSLSAAGMHDQCKRIATEVSNG